jgi:SAM-dependent methyltransferase
MMSDPIERPPALDALRKDVEDELQQVYNYCPPTHTHFKSAEARDEYQRFWGHFFTRLGVPPDKFTGAKVLDAGCGSCEKAAFYHDWGARVTGVDLTAEVLRLGRQTLGNRDVELIQSSLFDFDRPGTYDIAVIDGVSFVTADTFRALEWITRQIKPGGILVFSLTNVWGDFWWFRFARRVTGILGGRDFHKRASWGRRLFLSSRGAQEGTNEGAGFFRSEQSWAYDWFGPPAYHLHSPREIQRWLGRLGLQHLGSIPGVQQKDPPATFPARVVAALAGNGRAAMPWYWLVNHGPNMAYVAAIRKA